jgi:cold shock CspA family protein
VRGKLRIGVVSAFDEARGLGTVTLRDDPARAGTGRPGQSWSFHCTAIADGTRTIDVGTPVAFELKPGHLGRMEATQVTKLGAGSGGSGG